MSPRSTMKSARKVSQLVDAALRRMGPNEEPRPQQHEVFVRLRVRPERFGEVRLVHVTAARAGSRWPSSSADSAYGTPAAIIIVRQWCRLSCGPGTPFRFGSSMWPLAEVGEGHSHSDLRGASSSIR